MIFYKSFQYGKRQITLEESPGINEERKLINSILLKNRNMNVVFLFEGSAKVDVLLYGNILRKINFSQSLELFKLSNWNKTIPQHIDNFIRCENEEKNKEMVKLKKEWILMIIVTFLKY